ncbi:hypothetical protein [Weissella confusa]|uniref:hypothetical protein n=1 Tax=Weissella confusa TaxID=1583 RepID=UPI00223B383C|nr:hypothetical protein [Weissella confusa]MCS9991177.1 hypothetical protein [Weissella confusa]
MAKYEVLQDFTDALTDVVYEVGSEYPADAPAERIEKLLGSDHENFSVPLIKKIVEKAIAKKAVEEVEKVVEEPKKTTKKAVENKDAE